MHRGVARVELAQRKRDDSRVVGIWVDVVLVFECPAAGCEVRPANRPVAFDRDFLAEQIPPGCSKLRMIGGHAARAQREHREPRVPHRRLARLGTNAVAVLDHEPLPTVDRFAQRVVFEAVPERRQRDDPPHPRRLDAAPRPVRFLPVADPLLRRAQGTTA